MLSTVQISLIIVAVLAIANSCAEELETRKTVKKSAAIHVRNYVEPRAEELSLDEQPTADVEIVKDSSTTLLTPSSESPSTTPRPPSTTNQAPSTTTRAPLTTSQSPSTTSRLTTTVPQLTTETLIEMTTELPAIITGSPGSSTTGSAITIIDLDNEGAPDNFSNEHVSMPDIDDLLPFKEPPKRKLIYINQQQNGKLNVHLELSDVSLIVIPNQKDQNQLSLLNLLFKSAQKSKLRIDSEEKKKEEKNQSVDHHDDYSKYKETFKQTDEIYHLGTGNMPFVESRAPYKVDISSTLGQQSQPAVDITPNAQQLQSPQFQPQSIRSPMMQLLRPIPYASSGPWSGQTQTNERIFKRSIENIPYDFENFNEDELTESILNTLEDNDDDLNSYDGRNDSEFILLGAVENCGPGRRRNSYQVCVSVEDIE